MVEVDPTLSVLFAAAAVIVGIAAVAICTKSSPEKVGKSNHVPAQRTSTTSPAVVMKPKRKSRSKSKSKAKGSKSKLEENEEKEGESNSDSADELKKDNSRVHFDAEEFANADKNKKLKNKTSKKPTVVVKSPTTIVPETDAKESSDSDSSDDDEVIPAPVAPVKRAPSPLLEVVPEISHFSSYSQSEGWAVVEDKRKSKKKADGLEDDVAVSSNVEQTRAEPTISVIPVAPIIETVTSEIRVDAKKLGLLIGSKGATRTAIQNATGTVIQMPKAEKETVGPLTITVSGTATGVNKAITAMNELCIKGYCALLASDDFQESYVAVHPK